MGKCVTECNFKRLYSIGDDFIAQYKKNEGMLMQAKYGHFRFIKA